MKQYLKQLASIRTGYPGQPEKDGEVSFLQLRQFNEDGILISPDAEVIKLTDKLLPHLLKNGDVLLVAKGNRLFASLFTNDQIPTIASSSFFVITPVGKHVYPAYLAAILNAPQNKNALLQLGAGSNIFSIRKSELEDFEIPVPPLAKQKQIAKVAALHQQEIQLAKQIIEQKQALYKSIISKIIKL